MMTQLMIIVSHLAADDVLVVVKHSWGFLLLLGDVLCISLCNVVYLRLKTSQDGQES